MRALGIVNRSERDFDNREEQMTHTIERSPRSYKFLAILVCFVLCFALASSAQVGPDLFSGLQWRNVGPYHGARIAAVTGVIGEPGTFYVGLPQGGIWKTTSVGMTCTRSSIRSPTS